MEKGKWTWNGELGQDNKIRKIGRNRERFDEYDFKIIKEFNNIVEFEHNSEVFYFTEVNNQVRYKGSKDFVMFSKFIKGEY